MRNDGDDWAVVGGFAIGPVAAYPVRHVWVRNGRVHFDPMWSRRFAVVLRKIRRLVFEELVRSYFDRTVRSDGEALRVRGFSADRCPATSASFRLEGWGIRI
jgi:hypothetical protein